MKKKKENKGGVGGVVRAKETSISITGLSFCPQATKITLSCTSCVTCKNSIIRRNFGNWSGKLSLIMRQSKKTSASVYCVNPVILYPSRFKIRMLKIVTGLVVVGVILSVGAWYVFNREGGAAKPAASE